MIENERQYNVTKAAIVQFEETLRHADQDNAHLPPRIQRAMSAAIMDQLEELRQQVADYEARRKGGAAIDSAAKRTEELLTRSEATLPFLENVLRERDR